MPGYPTKEEILREPRPKHRRDVLAHVHAWKRTTWRAVRRGSDAERFAAIKSLTEEIAVMYNRPVFIEPLRWELGTTGSSYYVGNTIVLVGRPSIITALHELGHHLFGRSERKACRWSIWLFRKTFPLAYLALIWRGHLLVRPTISHSKRSAR